MKRLVLGGVATAAVAAALAAALFLVAAPTDEAQAQSPRPGGGTATPRPPAPAPNPAPTAAPAPPVSPEPATTTAGFGDWVVRCQRSAGDKPVRICEAAQTITVQGQAQPIAQIAIGRPSPAEPLQVTLVLPPNVAFPSSVHIMADEKDTPGFEIPWRRCLPGGCIADVPAREDAVKRWRAAPEAGRIVFRNAAGQDVAIPLSFRGLAQGLDALAREPS